MKHYAAIEANRHIARSIIYPYDFSYVFVYYIKTLTSAIYTTGET